MKKYSQVFGQGTSLHYFSQIPNFFEVSTPIQAAPFRTHRQTFSDSSSTKVEKKNKKTSIKIYNVLPFIEFVTIFF